MLFPKAGIINRTISLASTNATLVKGGPARVTLIYATNSNAAIRYVKLYNKATAPVVGTDVPAMTLLIPGSASQPMPPICLSDGLAFELGLGFGMTTGVADSDVAAVGANDVILTIGYLN